jgi:Domain of unknown function (DUF5658)
VIDGDGMLLAQPFAMMMRTTATVLGLVVLSSVPIKAAAGGDSPAPSTLTTSSEIAKPRPQIVPSLYASLAALQAFDGYSTIRAIRAGAREANPIVGNAAGQPIAMWTLKAASTAATIYYAERLWRNHHRGQAVTLLAVTNAIMGAVAAHNASILSTVH